MKYSLAYNWDSQLVGKIKTENRSKQNQVFEFFGSCDNFTAVPSKKISRMEAEKKINEIKKEGFAFNYLLNSILPIKKKELLSYISWVNTLGVDIVTVANEENISFLNKNFPKIPINISIVAGVDRLKKIKNLLKNNRNIKRITLKHSLNRNQFILKQISAYAKKSNIEIELLANELCFLDCFLIKKHYKESSMFSHESIIKKVKIDNFSLICNEKRVYNFFNFANTAWIRPEDVVHYERMGVDIIKIAGKTESTEYLYNTSKSFLEGRHDGNIMDLFSRDWWPNSRKPILDNRSLDGFLKNIWDAELLEVNNGNMPDKYKNLSFRKFYE